MPNAVTWKFRYALLTYAQCGDLDPWAIVHLFTGLRAECIVGREAHQDEGIHLHVFVDFGRVFRSRRTNAFDVEGRHPNVQHVNRTPWVAYDYAIKEGDVVAGGAERPAESGGTGVPRVGDVWPEIMAAESRDEFFDLLQKLAPRSLVSSFNSCRAFAEWRYRVDPEPYRNPDGLCFQEDRVAPLHEWAEENLGRHIRGKLFLTTSAPLRCSQRKEWVLVAVGIMSHPLPCAPSGARGGPPRG